ALAQLLRHHLDTYLSVAPLAGQPAEAVYQHALAWKGSVFARQRWFRLARSATDPEMARLVGELRQTATSLAALAFAVPEPQQLPARQRQLQELTKDKERLERELSGRSPAFRTEQERTRRAPGDLGAVLPDGVALIDLLEYTHRSPHPAGRGELRAER